MQQFASKYLSQTASIHAFVYKIANASRIPGTRVFYHAALVYVFSRAPLQPALAKLDAPE